MKQQQHIKIDLCKKKTQVVLSNILVTACLIGHLLESKFRSHEHNVRSHDTMLYYLLLQLMKSLHLDRGNRKHGNIHTKIQATV